MNRGFAFLVVGGLLLGASVPTGLMAQQTKVRVLVIVTNTASFPDGKATGVWFEEFATPFTLWNREGFTVTVASPKGGDGPIDPRSLVSVADTPAKKAAKDALSSTLALSQEIRAESYDAVFLPGGHGPLFDLSTDPETARIVSDFARDGKVVSAICHGLAGLFGATLANGEPIVKGKNVTGFSDEEEGSQAVPFSVEQRLKSLGGLYSKVERYHANAIEDGFLITGQNPGSSQKLAELVIARFKK